MYLWLCQMSGLPRPYRLRKIEGVIGPAIACSIMSEIQCTQRHQELESEANRVIEPGKGGPPPWAHADRFVANQEKPGDNWLNMLPTVEDLAVSAD